MRKTKTEITQEMKNGSSFYRLDFRGVRSLVDVHTVLRGSLGLRGYRITDGSINDYKLDTLFRALTYLLSEVSYIQIYGYEDLCLLDAEYADELLNVFMEVKYAFGDEISERFYVSIVTPEGYSEEL